MLLRITDGIDMIICNRIFLSLAVLILLATTASAMQSGSRGSAPAAQSFTSPQFSSPAVTFEQPPFQASGSSTRSTGSFPMQQSPTMVGSPMMVDNSTMSPDAAMQESSGSRGIPAASLVDPIFQMHNPNSPYVVDHSFWNQFLSRYLVADVTGLNRVRYGQVTCGDRQGLNCYLQQLQATDIRMLGRDEQLAFWFNLYNAKTVSLILENYPIRSVRQIKQKFTDFVGPFDDEGVVSVLGKSLSLNDIESGIVRPVWNDPRIHYALNCASFGCPNLAATPWTGQNIDARLNGAAYEFINSGRAVKRGLFGVRLSKIYKWYKADFGDSDQAVLAHVSQYANCETIQKISRRGSVSGYFYDWSLNDAKILRRRFFEAIIR